MEVQRLMRTFRVVGILGARQVGKTTLARQVTAGFRGPATFFDLERQQDVARLREPELARGALRGMIVLDEIQRRARRNGRSRVPPAGAKGHFAQQGSAEADPCMHSR